MLKALIFDVDGTLAETEETHRAAFNLAFAEAGLAWEWTEPLYRDLLKVTGGKERIAAFMAMAGEPSALESGAITDLHQRKTALYAEMIASGATQLRPGVAELIEGARLSGLRLAIATTTSRPNVDALLAATLGANGLAAFEVIAAGDSVPRKKPAPDIFVAALEQLHLRPSDCLAIEDSGNGVRSALGAGLPVLVTPSVYSRDDDFSGAARVVDTLSRLIDDADGEMSPLGYADAARRLHRDAIASLAASKAFAPAMRP